MGGSLAEERRSQRSCERVTRLGSCKAAKEVLAATILEVETLGVLGLTLSEKEVTVAVNEGGLVNHAGVEDS